MSMVCPPGEIVFFTFRFVISIIVTLLPLLPHHDDIDIVSSSILYATPCGAVTVKEKSTDPSCLTIDMLFIIG